MKIGIVTFWNSQDNYGQVLQAFALQRFLRNKGYDAFVIKYIQAKRKKITRWILLPYRGIKRLLNMFFKSTDYEINKRFKNMSRIVALENEKHPRHFDMFKNIQINFSDYQYNRDSIFKNPPTADVYIAGSDQIWRGLDDVFYLQFAPQGKKCIAYAPSFGGLCLGAKERKKIKKYLERFAVLGMRESKGVELCKSVGRNDAFLVMDPTLLLTVDDYMKILTPPKANSDYLFLYLLGNDMAFDISAIYIWAKAHGLSVKYVASQGQQDNFEKLYPNIGEWLGLLNGAKYVVTNSFHGTVFSVIMNKQFCTIPLTGSFTEMNGRVTDLLSNLGLVNRMYSINLDILSLPINYVAVNQKLQSERQKTSKNFDIWLHEKYN